MDNIQLSNGNEYIIEIKNNILKFAKKEFYFISELEMECLINKILTDYDVLNGAKKVNYFLMNFIRNLLFLGFIRI